MRGHAEMIANLDPSVPLIADADTGYGGTSPFLQSIPITHLTPPRAYNGPPHCQTVRYVRHRRPPH
jgi:hypothetical protein